MRARCRRTASTGQPPSSLRRWELRSIPATFSPALRPSRSSGSWGMWSLSRSTVSERSSSALPERRQPARPPRVVVDFDGTITEIDGLHLVLLEFGDKDVYEGHESRLGRD